MKVNSSAGWKEEGSGGSNARPSRVPDPALCNVVNSRSNDNGAYRRMVGTQERSIMIPCPQYEILQYCPAWKQIHQSERNKVLDEVIEFLKSKQNISPFTELYYHAAIEEIDKELRQAGEQ